ncbi:hypothetical protein COLO4_33769 [Corchorus olitorius]|uniref:Uncharacterized protein n=1 Tax=Corchorus olitorius TaxID=93759 RepID=A0A1R3GRM4_9ROSI|nr:hypothetical protein COLO4_33769 [Corchorus olitorius]
MESHPMFLTLRNSQGYRSLSLLLSQALQATHRSFIASRFCIGWNQAIETISSLQVLMAERVLDGYDEVLIIKSVTHRDFNAMIKSILNPIYLLQGIVLRSGAKGTGMKSIELALSMCDIVDPWHQ